MEKRDKELIMFLEESGLSHIKLPAEVGLKELMAASKDDLLRKYGVQEGLEDIASALSTFFKSKLPNKHLELGAGKMGKEEGLQRQKFASGSQVVNAKLSRRHSVYKEGVLSARLARLPRCSVPLSEPTGHTAKVGKGTGKGTGTLFKTRHLGHSAPDLLLPPSRGSASSSSGGGGAGNSSGSGGGGSNSAGGGSNRAGGGCNSAGGGNSNGGGGGSSDSCTNSSGDFSRHKASKNKHARPSLPLSQSAQHTLPSFETSPKNLDSPKVSSVLQQLHLRNSRRMSMNSFVSSEFTFQLSPSSTFSSRNSSQERLNDSLTNDNNNNNNYSPNTSNNYDRNNNNNNSGNDNYNNINNDQDFCNNNFRPRARSFNSPAESEPDIVDLNEFYRECFPKAIEEAEERLGRLLQIHCNDHQDISIKSDGCASFVLQQLLQLATDCLSKSHARMLSSAYLASLVSNMQGLLETAQTKAGSAREHLAQLAQDLLVIISRPARLLECLEFDPEDFYRRMGAVEGAQARSISDDDVFAYLLKQLEEQAMEQQLVRHGQRFSSNDMEKEEHLRSAMKTDLPLSSRPPTAEDFETIKLISNGAYGAVMLVRHVESRRLYAMKKMLKQNLVLRNMVNQVFTERDILTFIDNPFVVSFYCSFETKRHLCMLLEYIEGGDCAALLKNIQGPLPTDMSRLYFAETLMALEYLHNFGIVHRDLKPDNLLITSIGHIKLTDFGLSKIGLMKMTTSLYEGSMSESRRFRDCQVFGTPEYIAPEVILKMQYGKPVDWWSMGIILYQFLVGCVPFTGDTPDEVFSEIISGELEWPEEEEWQLSTEAEDLIEGLLTRPPEERLGSGGAGEVKAHAFFRGLDWGGLLRQKTHFVPDLSGEDDTSYFDERSDRYDHLLDDTVEDAGKEAEAGNSNSSVFSNFSTCSPSFKNHDSPIHWRNEDIEKNSITFEKNREEGEDEDRKSEREKGSRDNEGESGKEKERTSGKERVEREKRRERDRHPRKPLKNSSVPFFSKDSSAEDHTDAAVHRRSSLRTPHKPLSQLPLLACSPSRPQHSTTTTRSVAVVEKFLDKGAHDSGSSSMEEADHRTVVVHRGSGGFGFNIRGVRSYDQVLNKVHFKHLIVAVERESAAWKAGLRAGDCITHINNLALSSLNHSQAVRLMLSHERVDGGRVEGGRRGVVRKGEGSVRKPLRNQRRVLHAKKGGVNERRNIFRSVELMGRIEDEGEKSGGGDEGGGGGGKGDSEEMEKKLEAEACLEGRSTQAVVTISDGRKRGVLRRESKVAEGEGMSGGEVGAVSAVSGRTEDEEGSGSKNVATLPLYKLNANSSISYVNNSAVITKNHSNNINNNNTSKPPNDNTSNNKNAKSCIKNDTINGNNNNNSNSNSRSSGGLRAIVRRALRWHEKVGRGSKWYHADAVDAAAVTDDVVVDAVGGTVGVDAGVVGEEDSKDAGVSAGREAGSCVDGGFDESTAITFRVEKRSEEDEEGGKEEEKIDEGTREEKKLEEVEVVEKGVDRLDEGIASSPYKALTLRVVAGNRRVKRWLRKTSSNLHSDSPLSSPPTPVNASLGGKGTRGLMRPSISFSNKLRRPSTLALTRRVSIGCYPTSPLVFSSQASKKASKARRILPPSAVTTTTVQLQGVLPGQAPGTEILKIEI